MMFPVYIDVSEIYSLYAKLYFVRASTLIAVFSSIRVCLVCSVLAVFSDIMLMEHCRECAILYVFPRDIQRKPCKHREMTIAGLAGLQFSRRNEGEWDLTPFFRSINVTFPLLTTSFSLEILMKAIRSTTGSEQGHTEKMIQIQCSH